MNAKFEFTTKFGGKLNEICLNSELYLKSTLLKALMFEHVELICCRTSVLGDEIQSIKTSQDRSGSLSLLQANKCDQNLTDQWSSG